MKPIGADYFNFSTKDLISKINTNKINKVLLSPFNKFKSDYNLVSILEHKEMTKQFKTYALRLFDEYEHDKNLPEGHSGNIASISFLLLGNVDKNKLDINRVISD